MSRQFLNGILAAGKSLFNGPVGIQDGGKSNTRAGFFTEVNASIVDFGLNFYQLTNFYGENPVSGYQGGMLRFDGRSGQKLVQFLGSQGAAVVFSIDNSGNIIAVGTVTGDLTPAKITPTGGTSANLADILAKLANPGFTQVSDADYSISATDRGVTLTKLTAARTLTLPLISGLLNPTQVLRIVDASGSCSPSTPINIQPYSASGSDTIAGGSIALNSAYQWVEFVSPIPSLWVYR